MKGEVVEAVFCGCSNIFEISLTKVLDCCSRQPASRRLSFYWATCLFLTEVVAATLKVLCGA
jgi:hypothetical protein